jgi:anion-transporting  ArsA/GET3 family ATPase
MTPQDQDVLDRARLIVVTGKGGTGKSAVAAALAMAGGMRGRRTLVAEVEGRQGLAPLFGKRLLGHDEPRVAARVNGLAVDPEASLREYLGRYGFAPLARLLTWAKLTSFITAAAPGLGDVLLVGKVWEAATRGVPSGGRAPAAATATGRGRSGRGTVPPEPPGPHSYELVVLDAPPTGRVVPFLRAPETVAELARVGPIRHQADRVKALLDDPQRCAVLLTCLPEELPVTETLEAAAALRAAGLPLAGAVVSRVTPDRLGSRASRLPALAKDPQPLAKAAAEAGTPLEPEALGVLIGEARDRQRQVNRERRLIKELAAGLEGLLVAELPLLPGGASGPEAIHALAEQLLASPLAAPTPAQAHA